MRLLVTQNLLFVFKALLGFVHSFTMILDRATTDAITVQKFSDSMLSLYCSELQPSMNVGGTVIFFTIHSTELKILPQLALESSSSSS